eukprot:168872-Chlamydomonas_euryale.AAC.1
MFAALHDTRPLTHAIISPSACSPPCTTAALSRTSTVASALGSCPQDHDHAYVRVTFNLGASYDPFQKFPDAIFLKELSFRSSDLRHVQTTVQQIKMLRTNVTQRDKERAERANLVAQERLIPGKKVRARTCLRVCSIVRVDGWMGGGLDAWLGGGLDGWMDGWMD